MVAAGELALELRGVCKRFGLVEANRDVDLQVAPGEIRGIVGENGAGKSTLMSIASGLYSPDAGEVLVDGVARRFGGRDEAIALGINMVHQRFMLVRNCTVAQNVVIGETGRGPWLGLRRVEGEVRELAARYGLDVDPRARVEDLSPTQCQRVEILTALRRGRRVLILDEPTSVLAPTDIERLFETMRQIAAEGCAVIFTSHKLREVIEVCDAISVMRDGELRTTVARGEADVGMLASLMVGRELADEAESASLLGRSVDGEDLGRSAWRADRTVLRVATASGDDGIEGIGAFQVARGEILGVAGVEGNGQRQLAELLVGLAAIDGCRVELDGIDITRLGPRDRAAMGVAYVPEDPSASALVPGFPVSWNLALRRYRDTRARRGGWWMNIDVLRGRAAKAISGFDIRGATEDTRTAALSGGNQQKVVLARELGGDPKLLVVVDPIVGLDVGAAHGVHQVLREHRDRGAAIVLISTDLDEIEALSDRIAVLYRHRIVGFVDRAGYSRHVLGLMMTGLSQHGSTSAASQSRTRDVA